MSSLDAFEHEVWNIPINDSAESCANIQESVISDKQNTASPAEGERVLLLIDIWHPELELSERAAIEQMFQHARNQGWLKI